MVLLWYIVEGRIITMLMCCLDITAVTRMDSSPKNPVMFDQVKCGQTSLIPEKGGGVSERVTSLDN